MRKKVFRSVSLVVLVSTLALSGVMLPDVAQAQGTGCYATAAPATVYEQDNFTVTIQCDGIATTNNVYGFQFSTALAGDYDISVAPTTYSQGSFGSGATNAVLVGENTLPGMYTATRSGADPVDVTDFSLGTFSLTAEDDLTANGSVTVTMNDADFMLSDDVGAEIASMLAATNDVTLTITNRDLAWLTGDMVVSSDVTTISEMATVDLTIGGKAYNATNVATYTNTFTMDSAYQYDEGATASDGTQTVSVSADITGHLRCSNSISLSDMATAADVDGVLGTAGTITLKAGDADADHTIDIDDATLIGGNIGTAGASEEDVNGDTNINVLDLIHVGRNYNAAEGSCGTGGV